uniref:Uncharacterized protein n=1 Tax=Aegilops tauschii subsp. strangulata TaxID=200361 RepID=A0A452Y765_AEGTS
PCKHIRTPPVPHPPHDRPNPACKPWRPPPDALSILIHTLPRLPCEDASPWISIGATTAMASPPADVPDPAIVDPLHISDRSRG